MCTPVRAGPVTGSPGKLSQLSGFHPELGGFGSVKILSMGGTRTGTFAAVTGHIISASRALAVTYDDGGVTGVYIRLDNIGDATIDAKVDFSDLLVLAKNYGGSGKSWVTGDFSGDGQTNFADLLLLAKNYNTGGLGPTHAASLPAGFAADWALAQSLAPEPTTLGALAAVAIGTLRRVRRPVAC